MKISYTRFFTLLALFIGIALCSGLGFFAFSYHYKYTIARDDLDQSGSRYQQYGTLVAVDVEHAVIRIEMNSQTDPGSTSLIDVHVTPATSISRQDLTVSNGIYVGLSEMSDASLTDLQPGDHVAVQFVAGGDIFTAQTIVFGNPL